MGRFLRRAVLVFAALVVVGYAVGSLDWRPARATGPLRTVAHLEGRGTLRAAAARTDITPQRPVPLAGYAARYTRTHEKVADPIYARALVLQAGPSDAPRVALVSVELLLVTRELREMVQERVTDLGLGAVVVAATHTHAGPGGYARGRVQQYLGMGPYDPAIERQLADGIAGAVREAALKPPAAVALQAATLASEGVAVDRHFGPPPDAPLTSARLVDDGGAVAARIVVFGMHPTTYTDLDFVLSGDWPGRAMAKIEEEGGPALFFQGAGGDVTFFRREDIEKEDRAGVTGFRVSQLARATAVARGPTREVALDYTEVEVGLPPADARAAPWVARRVASNLLDLAAPRSTVVARLSLDPIGEGESRLALQFVPGEPVAALGTQWSALGTVVGLANDYIGYVERPENVVRGEREALRTYFGPSLSGVLEDALRAARTGGESPHR